MLKTIASPKKSLMKRAVIILLLLILPFNIIGIITSVLSFHASVKNAESAIEYTLASHGALLYNQLYNTNALLFNLLDNNELFKMYREKDDSAYQITRYQLATDMKEKLALSNAADYIFVYMPKRDDYILFPGYDAYNAGSRPYLEYISEYDIKYAQWHLLDDNITLLRILHDTSLDLYYGAFIDLTEFLQELEGIQGYDSIECSFHTEPVTSDSEHLRFNNKISDHVYLTLGIARKDLDQSISILQIALLLFFLVYLTLIPILIFLLKRYVNKPLAVLNRAHDEIHSGNPDYQIETPANSREFDYAYDGFNRMVLAMNEMHRQIMEKELSNKQLQIDFLQLQIRPHFLLNSFNVLYTLIQRGQKESAQQMVLFLSDYFRYLFRSGRELQLFAKEKKLIMDYMDITKIYYPDSFEVSYQLDPILDLMRIPPLLLHSFMENIIAHALLPTRKLHIIFSSEYDEGIVTFYISDDGKGMDEEALASINHLSELPIDDGKNVGIKNSIRRLKFYYGEEATVVCESEPNVGTTFTITIPYNLEEP